jgi:polyhydroxyalkanoate synthesis regulator protein
MEMFERAFAMFSPFARREGQAAEGGKDKPGSAAAGSGGTNEIDELKRQMEEMQQRLARLSDKDKT